MLKLISILTLFASIQVSASSQTFELSQESLAHPGNALTTVTLSSKSVMIEHESAMGPGCTFEGIQEEADAKQIVFAPINEDLRFGEACRVTVTKRNDGAINLSQNDECSGFCGANGGSMNIINISLKK